MEKIRIPNEATYSPVALTDVILAAPLLSRLLLGATPPGRLLQAVALGLYAESVLQDWLQRQGVRRIDFLQEFDADVRHLVPMPAEARKTEICLLVECVNDRYEPRKLSREDLAAEVDQHLTAYIANITGQWVETSTIVRHFSLAQLFFPFALGACDILSGDIAIFRDVGVFEPHIIAHELSHRKGYWKELEAQVLAYLSLIASGDEILMQSALCERLYRNLCVLSGGRIEELRGWLERAGLRPELRLQFLALHPPDPGPFARQAESMLKALYEERMRLTGQNGLSDYDLGFTNFLYTFETSATARQVSPPAGALHCRRV